MFVRDEAPDRAYVQLIKSYKADPASVMRELPHPHEATLNTVAQNLTVILWRDFAELVCGPGRDAESTAVKSTALDTATYAVSSICYFAVRKGKVTVKPRELSSHVGEVLLVR